MSLLPLLSFAQSNSKVAMPKNTQSNDKGPVEIKRNTLYNLDEIKVRWKKAALENCSGVPCNITTCTVATPSSITVTCGVAITPITIVTTGATGIGTVTGLPAGVLAVWSANLITISGTPSVDGTFSYTISLTGSCVSINATGTIIVTACPM
jgi:hypothetical protein